VADPEDNEQTSFGLLAPSELAKSMSYSDADRFRLGIEYDPVLPTSLVAIYGNILLFCPVYDPEFPLLYNGISYAFYDFDVEGYTDDPTITYRWFSRNDYDDSIWLGLADWDANVWEWFRCDATESLTLPSMAPYENDDGHVLAVMVVVDPDQDTEDVGLGALYFIRLGPRVGRWVVETIDEESSVAMVSLALGNNNQVPHIAYTDFEIGNSALMYTSMMLGWYNQVVDDNGDTGYYPTVIIKPDADGDLPQICYRSNTISALRLATSSYCASIGRDVLEWNAYMSIDIDGVNPVASSAIYHDDTYHISYQDFDTKSLNFVYFNGLDWVNSVVDDSADVGFTNSLAVDPSGELCISYRNEDEQSLMFAEYAGMTWDLSTIDAGAGDDIGMINTLVFGPDNHPQVCYDDATHQSTLWAHHDGTEWQQEAVFDLDAHNQDCAMVVDSAGIPHVATMDSDNNNLIHLWLAPGGETWLSEVLDFGGSYPTGYCVAMAIRDDDRLYIAYGGYAGEGAENALKFAYQVD
jgi:hypothetical protein